MTHPMGEPLEDGSDEFTELHDADVPRVDLVHKGANGIPFLIAKSAGDGAGLLSADQVRELVAKSDPEPEQPVQVTFSGSPAAVMKSIYEAGRRQSAREQSMQDDTVIKADDEPAVEVDDLVADAPGGSTAESVPGSPDWEELDAATAQNAIAVLARVKSSLQWLANREATEDAVGVDVAVGDVGPGVNTFDLDSAASNLDCIIRQLAGFAVSEQLEADLEEEEADLAKAAIAAAGALVEPLGVIETFGPVVKAGRVLSSANEERIRSASESLQQVLATLPAPVPDEVAKETDVDETEVAKADENEDAAPAVEDVVKEDDGESSDADVEKAKGDPQVAVYDEGGKLVGTVDPGDINPIASASPPDGGDAVDGDGAGEGEQSLAADAAPDGSGAAAEGDLQPQAPADAGVTTDAAAAPSEEDVAKAEEGDDERVADLVKAAITKEREEWQALVKSLEDRVAHLEAPAPLGVLVNGHPTPPPHLLRGQDHGAAAVDVQKAAELRTQLEQATDIAERERLTVELQQLATAELAAARAQRRG